MALVPTHLRAHEPSAQARIRRERVYSDEMVLVAPECFRQGGLDHVELAPKVGVVARS